MSTRADIVARWETQLQASESQAASGPPRLRWLWQMRVRLYRFLLLCYGDTPWEPHADSSADNSGPAGPNARLIDNTASTAGLLPKSPERIRSTLKSVHIANDRADEPGPFADGGFHCEWIRAASFRDKVESEPLMKELKAAGIEFRQWRVRWGYLVIEIRRLDYDAALECYDRARPQIALIRGTRHLRRKSLSMIVQAGLLAVFGFSLAGIGLF